MDHTQLKNYAPDARKAFIEACRSQAARLGITAEGNATPDIQGDVLLVGGSAFPKAVAKGREALVRRVKAQGFDATIDAIAYTWFNRFVAIRYMELHGYLDHGYRVLSHPGGDPRPEVLEHAADIELTGLDRDQVVTLKLDGSKDEELYRLLLLAQCNALHQAMPFLFEKIGDETELLLPANLLHSDSLIRQLVEQVDEALWQEIEIIGWLYQFYISEKKDEVIGKVVKSADIPAATQLFTPNWIVKYMVQNSLGAQWLATYPNSPLKGQMEYYIEPAEQTDEVNAQLAAITPSQLNPEELTLIDPASGSGHILVEAYELFKTIYLERGYRQRDVPRLILEKNLYGLDIDERAAQLTGFALMMKGRADDQRLFEVGVKLNVKALVDSQGLNSDDIYSAWMTLQEKKKAEAAEPLAPTGQLFETEDNLYTRSAIAKAQERRPETGTTVAQPDIAALLALFEHASTFGSLIQVPDGLAEKLPALKQLSEATSQDLFVAEALKCLRPLVHQAELLAAQYDVVVANPPYIGSKFHVPALKKFLKDHYKGYEKDVFSAFIDRDFAFSKPHGRLGFMSPFVWMFISSFEHLRARLVAQETITSLVQLEYSGFEGATVPICTFTLQKGHIDGHKGCFIRLSDFRGSENQAPKTREAIRDRGCGWLFEAVQDEFSKIPGSPIVYWASRATVDLFENPLLAEHFEIREGLGTRDDDIFLRRFWEVDFSRVRREHGDEKWIKTDKAGSFRKWYGNAEFVMNWENDGYAIKNHRNPDGSLKSRPQNTQFFFREAVSWNKVGSGITSFRWRDDTFGFNDAAPSVFGSDLETVHALLCSKLFQHLVGLQGGTLNVTTGIIKSLPALLRSSNARFAKNAIKHAVEDWDAYERSWDFQSLPLLTASSDPTLTLESSYTAWITQNRETTAEMKRLEEENNRLFIDAYGLADELTPDVPIEQITLTVNPAYRYGGKLTEEEQWTRFRQDTMEELVSYAIGCMMGRYSLDAPGLIYAHSGNEGFDPSRYPAFPADDDGIVPLTDTEWFDDDAAHRLIEFISLAWDQSQLEANLTFLAEHLSPKKNESGRETLRRYLCDSFFKDHLQTYKKRPIYWLFSSGKQKAFQCLVYLHRYNEGTLSRMRSEYVIPLQGKIVAQLEKLDGDIKAAESTAQSKRLGKDQTKLQKQQVELLAFDEKLRHYADQRITLDLDDGVKVNYGKFGDLLAEVKAVHGKKVEGA